ncbi:reverse transcriptase domain-containing protein [Tanacetum coccineum]|uniref:Reverse transcriptase domain-containing protein n=1 Tax=Tanacetum coccineum TaxID=301880 RepID=A0ABQ5EJ67_9ASTR
MCTALTNYALHFSSSQNEITQEVLNAAAGGIFFYKTPNQAYQLLEDKVLLKLDWAKNQKTKSSLKKTVAFADEVAKNHQASIQNLETKFDRLADKRSGRPSGYLPSNTQPNHDGSNSKAYQPPQAHNEHVNVVFIRSGKSYNLPENPNKEQNKTKNPINFYSVDEDDEPTPQPKIQTKKPVKETPLPKPYKPKIIIKFHQNLETPEVSLFHLISTKLFSCNALSDLDASINLMPYSLYAKLSLETLKPTKISVRLADRSFQYPVRIAENMLVEVAKFIFPADFVILEMEEDSKVPLILGRPFLHTADAVIRVKHKQLNLGVKAE